jgi:hypothetical protein
MSVRGLRTTAVGAALATAVAVTAGLVLATGHAAATRAGAVPQDRNCIWQLLHGRSEQLVCDYPAFLTDEERNDLTRISRGLVTDASCMVSVRIERRLIMDAAAARDVEFKTPPQRVTCNIHTKDVVMPISGTFAPRVVLKDGRAVDASPTLADVQGVHAALAWPVVEYVNRSATIRDGMLKMINAYLERRGAQARRS